MNVELRAFGGLSLFVDGRLVSGAAAQPRRLAVLAVLAHAWPAAVTRDRLVGLIWPEQDEAGARRLLTQAIYELRRELGEFTHAAGRDIALDPGAIRVDLVHFRRAMQAHDWEQAARLYTAPFLDGFYLRGAAEFERWTADVRDELHRDAQRAAEQAIVRFESAGSLRDALYWAQRRNALAPLDARAVLRVVDLATRAGDPLAARKAADDYTARMRDEMGSEPDPEILRRVAELHESTIELPEPPIVRSMPLSYPTPATRESRRRRVRVAAAAVVVGLAGLTITAAVRGARWSDAPRAPVVRVDAFETRGSADTSLAGAVRGALVATLDGSGGVRVDTSAADDGWAVLSGAVTATDAEVRLDATLVAPDSTPPVRVSVTGSRDSLVTLVEQLSLELLPALYPELRQAPGIDFARRFRRVAAARRYLDGELAFHRGAFEEAYRAFAATTDLDSTATYAWYRRAVAAEDAHRIADADRSAMFADRTSAGLAPRDRGLIHAYAVWRSGDTRTADSLYRALLAAQPNDAEVWFQFAEVAYHNGPLIGRSQEAALDAWRRAASLDSTNFPALMHLLRLESRLGDTTVMRSLMQRIERIGADEPLISEVRAMSAAVTSTVTGKPYEAAQFERMPDASVHYVHSIVAGLQERPDLARVAATAMIDPSRPTATRAEGFSALAHIAVSRGQLTLAAAMLDSLARYQPSAAALWREYFSALPFVPAGAFGAQRAESASPSAPAGAPLYLEVSVDAAAAPIVRAYTTALARRDTRLSCESGEQPSRDLCADLERGLRAEAAVVAGDSSKALALLESMSMRAPYQLAGRSVFYSRTRERFRRAQLLERAGRLDEAYDWYAATPQPARFDYIYLAPSHLARGRIRERQGDRAAAREHYHRAAELWRDADSAMAPARREAEEGLRRASR